MPPLLLICTKNIRESACGFDNGIANNKTKGQEVRWSGSTAVFQKNSFSSGMYCLESA